MRYSVGGGIRINFPFLGFPIPISLYFGTPLQKEDEDDARLFLFTIGTPF
jgi:outer membrane protein assembly factor BamA